MRIERPVDSLSTFIVIDQADMVTDHVKRYYAVPKDYRVGADNPYDNEPSVFVAHDVKLEGETATYLQAMDLMVAMYWKILADLSEANYNLHNPK